VLTSIFQGSVTRVDGMITWRN